MLKRRRLLKMMKRRRSSLMTEKVKKRRNKVYLPEELLVETLSRVPEASLARFRSTSKGWNALINKDKRLAKNSLFVMVIRQKVYLVRLNLHDDKAEKVITQCSLSGPLSSSSSLKEVGIRCVFHCDGLLLCTTMDERLVVWNPCSKETSSIIKPLNSIHNHDTYALGKSSCNNEYKILRVHHRGNGLYNCLVQYEIYDFTSNSWRVLGETREWSLPGFWRHGTSVDGNTYWLSFYFSQDRQRLMDTLRCFDFSTERFGIVSLPGDPLSYNLYGLSVTRQEKNLCILTSSRDKEVHDIDVWMATKIKGTGDMSWSKILTVKRTHSQQFLGFRGAMSFSVDRKAKVILHPTKYKNSNNCLHIVGENNKHIKVDIDDVESKHSSYVKRGPTLVHIQQGSLGLGTWKAPVTKFS